MVDPKMLELSHLRGHPAPAAAGGHRSEEGGPGAALGGRRDGAPLRAARRGRACATSPATTSWWRAPKGDARALLEKKQEPAGRQAEEVRARSLVVGRGRRASREDEALARGEGGGAPPACHRRMAATRGARGLDPGGPPRSRTVGDPRRGRGRRRSCKKLPYIVVIIDEFADLMMVRQPRGRDLRGAAGAEGARRRHPPDAGDAAAVGRRDHRPHQGQLPHPHQLHAPHASPTRAPSSARWAPRRCSARATCCSCRPPARNMLRVHGAFVSETEIQRVVDFLKEQGKPVYDSGILKPREEDGRRRGATTSCRDELYDQAVAIVCEMRQASISMLQRRLRIGYNRAARMVERMERDGIVGPANGAKPREVLLRAARARCPGRAPPRAQSVPGCAAGRGAPPPRGRGRAPPRWRTRRPPAGAAPPRCR